MFDNKTKIVNNYLIKDIQEAVTIPKTLNFLPLYLSPEIITITNKLISPKRNLFNYRCDLHNFTQKEHLSDLKTDIYRYKTIHTAKKTRYADKKQDIYDKWIIIIPLSTYYIPYIEHNTNTTQSVGYLAFDEKTQAEKYLQLITQKPYKLLIHLTRYGNFNNIMVLKHLNFSNDIVFTQKELAKIEELLAYIKY